MDKAYVGRANNIEPSRDHVESLCLLVITERRSEDATAVGSTSHVKLGRAVQGVADQVPFDTGKKNELKLPDQVVYDAYRSFE
jgi:hypothetical protein